MYRVLNGTVSQADGLNKGFTWSLVRKGSNLYIIVHVVHSAQQTSDPQRKVYGLPSSYYLK